MKSKVLECTYDLMEKTNKGFELLIWGARGVKQIVHQKVCSLYPLEYLTINIIVRSIGDLS